MPLRRWLCLQGHLRVGGADGLLLLLGLCWSLVSVPASVAAFADTPSSAIGDATTLYATARQISGVIGSPASCTGAGGVPRSLASPLASIRWTTARPSTRSSQARHRWRADLGSDVPSRRRLVPAPAHRGGSLVRPAATRGTPLFWAGPVPCLHGLAIRRDPDADVRLQDALIRRGRPAGARRTYEHQRFGRAAYRR